jgi:osmoprotectant transport system permease protein
LTRHIAITFLCALLLAGNSFAADERAIVVGSKNFTEGVVLGELIRAMAASTGATAEHRQALGGTRLVFNALVSGEIDIYAEYTNPLHTRSCENCSLNRAW